MGVGWLRLKLVTTSNLGLAQEVCRGLRAGSCSVPVQSSRWVESRRQWTGRLRARSAAEPCASRQPQMEWMSTVVVDLPLLPVTPTTRPGFNCQNRFISLASSTCRAGKFEEPIVQADGGIGHDEVRVREIALNGRPGEARKSESRRLRERLGESARHNISDGDTAACPIARGTGQPPRRRQSGPSP